ncbi:hypothetical protein VSX64_19895 [Aurantimonas sp. C2-6-R+9]|uniref:DUF7302 family protein n=1 Tax=unclassified Aurantimonas TaxID=2638230 RepID=UPI002E194780|nr:hypothetical protein [Aurantimonas sp. C2-6-R+9]
MHKLRAITEIWAASGRMVNSGRFDAEGNPILQVETIITKAGSIFEVSDEEAEKLIANGAAAPADDETRWHQPPDSNEGN